MSDALLSSKTVVRKEEPQVRNIPEAATAVLAAVGIAQKGPVGEATLCTSEEDYRNIFGGYTTDSDLATQIAGIYRQDPGAWVWVVRTVHYTDIDNPASKTSDQAEVTIGSTPTVASGGAAVGSVAGPWNLNHAEVLVIHCDEDVGGPDTATFNGTSAKIAGAGGITTPDATDTVTFEVDSRVDQQTVTFAGTETTVQLIAQAINEQCRGMRAIVNGANVDLEADTEGTDSSIEVVAETGGGAGHIGHTVTSGSPTTGGGNVGDIHAVTFAEAKSIIEAAVINPATGVTVTQNSSLYLVITSDTTGPSSSIMIETASTADGFGFTENTLYSGSASSSVNTLKALGKYDGTYAEDVRVVISDASDGDSDHFNWTTQTSDGVVLENTFANLQNISAAQDNWVEDIINHATTGSKWLEAEDLAQAVRPANGTYAPISGDDGLTSLDDNDFLGSSIGRTGIHALDLVSDPKPTVLMVPGRTGAAIHTGMISYSVSWRSERLFCVLDPPEGYTASQMVTYVGSGGANLKNLSEIAAIYWPRIKVLNPNKAVFGAADTITVPVCGYVAGVMSRTDKSQPGGVYQPPAGVERGIIFGCLGFETDEVLDESVRDLIYPERINPINSDEGYAPYINGLRTLKPDGNFPTVAESRGAIYIQERIWNGTQFSRLSNIDEILRAKLYNTIYNFLLRQMRVGAFRSRNPAEAYYVDVSEALNPPSEQFANRLWARVGIASAKPNEWTIILFSQDERQLLEELASA